MGPLRMRAGLARIVARRRGRASLLLATTSCDAMPNRYGCVQGSIIVRPACSPSDLVARRTPLSSDCPRQHVSCCPFGLSRRFVLRPGQGAFCGPRPPEETAAGADRHCPSHPEAVSCTAISPACWDVGCRICVVKSLVAEGLPPPDRARGRSRSPETRGASRRPLERGHSRSARKRTGASSVGSTRTRSRWTKSPTASTPERSCTRPTPHRPNPT